MHPADARALSLGEAFEVVAARADLDPLLTLGAALSGPDDGGGRAPLTRDNVEARTRAALIRAGHTPPPE